MAKINIRELFKKQMLALSKDDANKFPNLTAADFAKFDNQNTSLMSGRYDREDLNIAWIGFCAMLEGFDQLDVAISIDMTAIGCDDEGNRVFAKVEEWNSLTHSIDEGSEVSLVAVYQSHNFDISTFKDPYTGKNKKYRPK